VTAEVVLAFAVFDPDGLPLTAAYLAALPQGLDSYPSCRVRTTVTRLIIDRFPHVLDHAGIDRTFVDRLRSSFEQGEWMPETIATAVRALARDTIFASDAEYNGWSFEAAKEVFARPVYRVLMYVLSPSIVVLGASRRWNAFREGTHLSAKPHAKGGDIELKFPPNLFPAFVVGGFGEAFRASLVAARAHGVRVDLQEVTADRARWSIGWD